MTTAAVRKQATVHRNLAKAYRKEASTHMQEAKDIRRSLGSHNAARLYECCAKEPRKAAKQLDKAADHLDEIISLMSGAATEQLIAEEWRSVESCLQKSDAHKHKANDYEQQADAAQNYKSASDSGSSSSGGDYADLGLGYATEDSTGTADYGNEEGDEDDE